MKTIKTILKKILPVPFLKQAFLIYNKARIRTVDKLLFPEYIIPEQDFTVYRKGYAFRENNIHLDDLPAGKVKDLMTDWFAWSQEEFLLTLNEPCIIEPKHGWAIVRKNQLVYYSLGVSRTWFQPKPELIRFLRRKKVQHVARAISLRDTGEENYFHFFNDVLAKLFFLQENNIDVKSIPVIISNALWNKPYFQSYYKQSALLRSLEWIRQDDQYISCSSVIFCKPLTHKTSLWNAIVAPLRLAAAPAQRRVFLTRSRARLRFLENGAAIENICIARGFEIVDTDQLTPEQQIKLFSETCLLVGLHGAGLTNIIFMPSGGRVLEIFPTADEGYLPFHYIMLAKMGSLHYNAIIGEAGKIKYSGGFFLAPEKFEHALQALLAE